MKMNVFSRLMILVSMVSVIDIYAQVATYDNITMLQVEDLSCLHNDVEYDPVKFNYHEYEEVNLQDFGKSFSIDDVKRYTLFGVFSYTGTNDLFQINSDNNIVSISNEMIKGRQNINIEADEYFSHFLLYSGSSGKQAKEDILPRMQVGLSDSESKGGIVNLAEIKIFDRILSKQEIKRYESHLALKYGISLPQDSTYVNMIGEVVYDPSFHKPYTSRVVAIAHDQDLNTSQITHHREHFLRVGIDGVFPIQKLKDVTIERGSYLFFGDNDGELLFKDNSLDRIWKVVSSNEEFANQDLYFKFPIDDIANYDSDLEYSIILSDSDDLQSGTQTYTLRQIGKYLIGEDVHLLDSRNQYLTLTRKEKSKQYAEDITMIVNNLQIKDRDVELTIQSKSIDILGDVYVYSLDGYLVSKINVDASDTFEHRISFDFPGVYFISFVSGATQMTKKVIIQ